jgi:hypothetical protein
MLEFRRIPYEKGNIYVLISIHCNPYHHFAMRLKGTGVGLLEDVNGHASITSWVQE